MKTSTAKIYICEYCSKKSTNQGAMGRHEKSCKKNPKNDTLCKTCKHCVRSEKCEDGYTSVFFLCNKTNNLMHSPKVLRMSNPKKMDIIAECPALMPTVSTGCPFYDILPF